MSASLLEPFASLEDPRVERNPRHALLDRVWLRVCAVVSGAHGGEVIEALGEAKLDGLRKFGRFDNGAPSHDGVVKGVSRPTPTGCGEGFRSWTQGVAPATGGEVIAVDAKSARGSRARRCTGSAPGRAAIALVLGQAATEEKSHAITAIPKLLERLELKAGRFRLRSATQKLN